MPTVTVPIRIDSVTMGGRRLEEFRQKMTRAVAMAIRTAARSSEARLRAITPVSGRPWERAPGGLQQSLRVWESREGLKAEWTAPYASWVDEGTSAHAVTGDMHWQPGPGVWGHSTGHMIRGIRPHNLRKQAEEIMCEELELALFTMILAEAGGMA